MDAMRQEKIPGQGARILLVDDHPAVRQGLSLLLAQDHHVVCGEAASLAETLSAITGVQADLALVDLSLGGETGFDLIGVLRARGIRVLVYSMHEDVVSIERGFRSGADGYLSKREESGVLRKGVLEVLAGRRFVSPRGAEVLGCRAALPNGTHRSEQLSEREVQILDALGAGQSLTEMANALTISVRTVESYCARIIEKLKLSGMKELRQYAIRHRV
ncbi:response regulator transcription factor [Uliginosibacterium sp. 31-16]|uniref:response regulator n=1 Tax=Uliginosibacterium sp. 31-16 TaxID=3068315 RepID=UPI00273FC82A|nr:response regulator transcription factor [Uliginosibacterium sp. 31-16]MDP5238561.1 response regulator transcription factor [Uliginosibacterium sp. 31-16]